LVERFSQWQAGQASAEPESSLNRSDWSRLDAKVKAGFRKAFKPLWTRPAFWITAGGLSLAGLCLYLALAPGEPTPAPASMEEGPAFRVERQAESDRKEVPSKPSLPPTAVPQASRVYRSGKMVQVKVQRRSPGMVQVLIKDGQGKVLRRLFSGTLQKGLWTLEWDGRDDSGRTVSPGAYRVEVDSDQGRQEREVHVFGRAR
jgi:hypothetical protein